MGKYHPKDSKPGYRVQPGATNGPYSWGNGPKPPKKSGCCSYQEAGRALLRRKYKLALRYVRIDVKARLGII